jgi:hypothetical protein
MNQRTTNVVCLLLAVAGISFGVGQSVGQDRADADTRSVESSASGDKIAHRLISKKLSKLSDAVSNTRSRVIGIESRTGSISETLGKVRANVYSICLKTDAYNCQSSFSSP